MADKYNNNFTRELEELLSAQVRLQEAQEQREQAELRAELREKRRQRELKRRRQRRNRAILLTFLILALVTAGVGGFFLYQSNLTYSICRIEAGGTVTVQDFLKKADENAYFTESSDTVDTRVPGSYYIEIKTGIFTTFSTLIVQDTVAPALELDEIVLQYGKTCDIKDFVAVLEDATNTTLSFETEPDFSRSGKQTVRIAATDLGGNVTVKETMLWLTPVIPTVHVELGSELPDCSELVAEGVTAEYVSVTADCNTIGTYTAVVLADGIEYEVSILVEDTTGPDLQLQDVTGYAMVAKSVEDFVLSSEDLSGVASIAFKEEPDFNYIGEQTVTIIATDNCGNQTEQQGRLVQLADEEPPVVEGTDFIVWLGDTVAYKSKVSVTDNCETGLNLSVDATAVDLKTEGEYPVVYTATDAAGNITTKTLTVTVKEYRADEQELYAKIDAIFEEIFTEDMTNRQRCKAIYDYIRRTVSYVSYSEKGDVIKAALEGLTKGKGDCYVYFSLSKVMLTRAGFPNMDIERIRVGDSMHFWNLVDIGDGHGWYHFDTTPRVGGPYIFLWDDAKMWEYSDTHNGSHNYDKSLYPEIN